MKAIARGFAALGAGALFGLGLGLSGMVDPRRVLGFLDVAGAWDGHLALVLAGALAVSSIGFRLVLRRPAPRYDDRFRLPTARAIDRPLVTGALIFGIGWGLAGYCPGPAIASLGLLNPEALWFVPAMALGMALRQWRARRERR